MFIVDTYPLAIFFCVVTMFCWGSWANTQKLAGKSWRFELFYWDYVIGILLLSLVSAFTLGSVGRQGRPFLQDLAQADAVNIGKALLGGVIFNAANILLSAAIAIAGMAVAFPIGIGLALVLGVLLNYSGSQKGDPVFLFSGVALVVVAILLNAAAYGRMNRARHNVSRKGILLSLTGGLLMSFFYRFVSASMDLENFVHPRSGLMTPYTAVFIFSAGIFVSNLFFNTLLIRRPFENQPTSYREYFAGSFLTHLTGIFGGLIWGTGNALNLIAAGKAGAAVSYGLGQGATLIAAFWGVFIWKEFRQGPRGTNPRIAAMFLCFVAGLALIIRAGHG